ncbi:MAG TPA: hypothetical protein VFM37_10900, partial [Pseudonocardiaceae bacterium]|nr:hypothetical protein [Pseudonocardiaceae bacterium]
MSIESFNTPAPREQGGFWRGIAGWFRRRRDWPSTQVSERRTSTEPLIVPADGDVFHFRVNYEIIWTARGMSHSALLRRADNYTASAQYTLHGRVWPIGRRYLPQHPEAAEQAMNRTLTEGWCYDDGTVSCSASVQVVPDERVLAKQLPLWERLVEMDLEHRVQLRRLGITEDLLTRWRDLIKRFDDDRPLVIHAAMLADKELAVVLRGLNTERRANAKQLADVLREAS